MNHLKTFSYLNIAFCALFLLALVLMLATSCGLGGDSADCYYEIRYNCPLLEDAGTGEAVDEVSDTEPPSPDSRKQTGSILDILEAYSPACYPRDAICNSFAPCCPGLVCRNVGGVGRYAYRCR